MKNQTDLSFSMGLTVSRQTRINCHIRKNLPSKNRNFNGQPSKSYILKLRAVVRNPALRPSDLGQQLDTKLVFDLHWALDIFKTVYIR